MTEFARRGGGFMARPAPRFAGRTPDLPSTAEMGTRCLGLTLGGLYLCRDASGSLVDVLGGTSLAAVGSPAYAAPVGDRIGVRYPAASGHGADVGALGLASGWYAAIFRISDPALGTPAIVGRYNAAFNRCVEIYSQIGGVFWTIRVHDGTSVASPSGTLNVGGGTWLAQIQIDRADSLVRARMTQIGTGRAEQIQASIAGFLTLDGVGLLYGFGAPNGTFTGGATIGWGAWATGVQCEGAAFLATTAQRMGVE